MIDYIGVDYKPKEYYINNMDALAESLLKYTRRKSK
jgi:hypothetical protein